MLFDKNKLYELPEDFFELHGNISMKLTAFAAIKVCQEASKRQLGIYRVEGGIWHNPGFEARIDCIWDSNLFLIGNSRSVTLDELEGNNAKAEEFILDECIEHNVFIISLTTKVNI